MGISIENACKVIGQMNQHLRTELLKKDDKFQEEKLWENTYIKQQIDKRNDHSTFSVEDHICAMVYSMLSSTISWDRIATDIHPESKRMISVDKIFCDYDTEQLLKRTPEQLRDALKDIKCASQVTLNQMKALLSSNIPKLLLMEKEYGAIDVYYRKFIEIDATMKSLVTALSASNSKDKMVQMDIALVCEYLRNIGYDLPKPERHIRRVLGSGGLALSSKEEVPPFEAFDFIVEIAERMKKDVAEVDYILWSYCADGYGEICTKKAPKCGECVAREYCGKAVGEKEEKK